MIEVQHLTKRFGTVRAVNQLSFRAPDGAITGLLGANGAGKTTTLRMICGVLNADAGRIRIDAAGSTDRSIELQGRVGALLDHAGLYERLTARENLTYFGRLRGMSPDHLDERVNRVLSELGLKAIADRRTGGFSQGERMKTALGRALLHAPRNVVLDEPTNGLDVPTVRALRDVLRHMRDSGICVVFSSHVLGEVRLLCDRVAVIARGAIVAEGSPEELCENTRSASLEDAFLKLTNDSGRLECTIHA
jgi:sodium transport system ATP-binding protein